MNYIGSKYSLLEFIDETITKVVGEENIKDKVFADLFAGTGVVGNLFYNYILSLNIIIHNMLIFLF